MVSGIVDSHRSPRLAVKSSVEVVVTGHKRKMTTETERKT
jgi:hypothetical protein